MPLANESQNSRSGVPSTACFLTLVITQDGPDRRYPSAWLVDLRVRVDQLLDLYRESLQHCMDGLSESEVRLRLVPSQTTVLGLVKHITYIEESGSIRPSPLGRPLRLESRAHQLHRSRFTRRIPSHQINKHTRSLPRAGRVEVWPSSNSTQLSTAADRTQSGHSSSRFFDNLRSTPDTPTSSANKSSQPGPDRTQQLQRTHGNDAR